MMQSALDLFLRRFVIVGRLTVHWPDGRTRIYAGAPGTGTGNIPVPISARERRPGKRRGRPRSATSPPSSAWIGAAYRCSTSGAAGAAWR